MDQAQAQMQQQLVAANAQILALAQMIETLRTDQERLRRVRSRVHGAPA